LAEEGLERAKEIVGDKHPWSLKKAQLPAFLRDKRAALLALEKRQRKGWRHLLGKW
jgi:hypothetical protein